MVYPAPPCVTFRQLFPFDFPLRHIGQSVFPHSFVSAGDFLHRMLFYGYPPCSTILGLTLPSLCFSISTAMFVHILVSAPFGVAGQNTGNVLCASPLFLFERHVFSFIFLSFLRSSLFHSFSLWSGLFPVLSCSNLLSQFLKADWKMFNLNLSLYPDCSILWLNLDNSCAVLVHGTIGLVFSKILRAIWVMASLFTRSRIALLCIISKLDAIGLL